MRAEDVGLTPAEYQKIVSLMSRHPNDLELGLFGAMWSEHCSYKSSKALLAQLPRDGRHLVQGPGENAGVVRLTNDIEVAFKVESHNHPSYVEPVQGAATGVGGILRDIIAMGARPLALADMLRCGRDTKSLALLRGVIKGVGQYGNAIGIPTVTGDLAMSDTYRTNPLVNVLALGIRHPQKRIGASTAKPGDLLILAGQRTGRDGIHGASLLASRDFSRESADLRPTVQVGDPFLGKLLMEATLEVVEQGLLSALQDLGAAGLTSATGELCHSSGVGAILRLDAISLRQPGLSAYEIMLSETQERMLMAVSEENLAHVKAVLAHFEVPATVIGQVTADGRLVIEHHGVKTAELAALWLVSEAPQRAVDRDWWESLEARPAVTLHPEPQSFRADFLPRLLADPDVRDRSFVYRQYDSMIQTNTVVGPGHDAAVLRIRGAAAGICLSVFGTGRWAAVDPYAGGAGAVLYTLAALAAQGSEPLGLTDGINAGNPEIDSSYRALAGLIRGVSDAAAAAGVPVTGGNVSLHNQTGGTAIWPTVMIGAVGRHPHPLEPVGDRLDQEGDLLYLVNPGPLDLGGSVASLLEGEATLYPRAELTRAAAVLNAVREWAASGGARAMRVVGTGGLAATLVRLMAFSHPDLGIDVRLAEMDEDKAARFYNEAALQWVAVVPGDNRQTFLHYWRARSIDVTELGMVTSKGMLRVDNRYQWSRADLMGAWHQPWEEGRR